MIFSSVWPCGARRGNYEISCDEATRRRTSATPRLKFQRYLPPFLRAPWVPVAALLDHGAAVDTRDLHNDLLPYPLHVAAYNGYHRVTKLLFERGADRYPVNGENQTAHALCKKKWIEEGGDALDRCCELLRLEPTVVEGVYVAQTTDRSITIEWPVPPEHKVNKLEADQIVEAYKATAIESGVGSEERTLIRKRSECLEKRRSLPADVPRPAFSRVSWRCVSVRARTGCMDPYRTRSSRSRKGEDRDRVTYRT